MCRKRDTLHPLSLQSCAVEAAPTAAVGCSSDMSTGWCCYRSGAGKEASSASNATGLKDRTRNLHMEGGDQTWCSAASSAMCWKPLCAGSRLICFCWLSVAGLAGRGVKACKPSLGRLLMKTCSLPPAPSCSQGQVMPREASVVTIVKKRKDYAFRRQFNEKPRITPGCPGIKKYLISFSPPHCSSCCL